MEEGERPEDAREKRRRRDGDGDEVLVFDDEVGGVEVVDSSSSDPTRRRREAKRILDGDNRVATPNGQLGRSAVDVCGRARSNGSIYIFQGSAIHTNSLQGGNLFLN